MKFTELVSPVTHLCFLDDDPISSLTPLIDSQFPSENVVYFGFSSQRQQADSLKQVLKKYGVKVTFIEIPESEQSEKLSVNLKQHINRLNKHEGSRVFNASCGSRVQVLTANSICNDNHIPVYMVEPTQDRITWISPSFYDSVDVEDRIGLSHFLKVYQSDIFREISFDKLHSNNSVNIFSGWLKDAVALSQSFGQLNAVTAKAKSNNITPSIEGLVKQPKFNRLIEDLKTLGYGEVNHSCQFAYANEDYRKMGMGMWLEYITLAYVNELKESMPVIQDTGWGIEVSHHNDLIKNELDVCFLANNKLHVVECKTKKYQGGEVKSIIHQVEVLADVLGGYSARGALVTLKGVSSNDRLRAEELGIQIFGPEHLPLLKTYLKMWISKA